MSVPARACVKGSMKNADYRKLNDGSQNSSKYHKKDGTAVRAKLKASLRKEIQE